MYGLMQPTQRWFLGNNVFTVDVNGNADFPTLTAAMAAVPAGSIVMIAPGTYPEYDINLVNRVTIWGSGKDVTTIGTNVGSVSATLIASGVTDINIYNCTLKHSGTRVINTDNTALVMFHNCELEQLTNNTNNCYFFGCYSTQSGGTGTSVGGAYAASSWGG